MGFAEFLPKYHMQIIEFGFGLRKNSLINITTAICLCIKWICRRGLLCVKAR
jgi:hypothetical protein